MAADPQSWTELKARIVDWSNRDDADIDMLAAEAIALTERRFNRTLRVPEMEAVVSSTTVAGTISLPIDFLQARAACLATDPKTPLEQMTLADLRNRYPASMTGRPQNYAIQAGNALVFGPSPDANYPIILNYYRKIPALGSGEPSNWLLTGHPDIYLWGALAELFDLLRDERADRYERKLAGRIDELNAQARRKAFGAAPLRIRPPIVV